MKEIKLYECSICGIRYGTKERCEKCEKSHHKPVGISSFRYKSDPYDKTYPEIIYVKMDNGCLEMYRREDDDD